MNLKKREIRAERGKLQVKGFHNFSASHNILKGDLIRGNHVCGINSRVREIRKWCKLQYGITQGTRPGKTAELN
jgi:hypothetical protein